MSKCTIFAASAALIASGTVLAQDIPDQNPVPNADGTSTYYTGNNVQFPRVQDAIDLCQDGDQIVIMDGQYVESLVVDRNDITIRPATSVGADGPQGGFQSVTMWNPTEGTEADNGFAILCGPNTSNTYIGRPREVKRLANGDVVATQVPFGGAGNQEWVATATYANVCDTSYTTAATRLRTQDGLAGSAGSDLAMVFWSRSIDDVAVRTLNSKATFNYCDISSHNGFGGGVILEGTDDSTALVGCNIHDTYSGGQTSDGLPVHAVTIFGGNPMFAGVCVHSNMGGAGGILHQFGGTGTWTGCTIGGATSGAGNNTPVSDGVFVCHGGGHPTFSGCTFENNMARFGTVYFDSSANGDADHMLFTNCIFKDNTTLDDQWGAVMSCDDSTAGRDPLCVFDRCIWDNPANNGGTQSSTTAFEADVRSNYFPRYRILRDLSTAVIDGDTQDSGVGNADGDSVGSNPADINADGVVNGLDLALLLGAWQ